MNDRFYADELKNKIEREISIISAGCHSWETVSADILTIQSAKRLLVYVKRLVSVNEIIGKIDDDGLASELKMSHEEFSVLCDMRIL